MILGIRIKLNKLLGALISVLLAFIAVGILMLILKKDPLSAYASMLMGALGTPQAWQDTLNKMAVFVLTGLSCAFAYKCGLMNIGAQGQLYMGGLCAYVTAMTFDGLPAYGLVPLCVAAGAFGGALWGMAAGALKVWFGASEVITTVMLNYIALHLVSWLTNGPLKDPSSGGAKTPLLSDAYWLDHSFFGLHGGWLLALLALVGFGIFFAWTKAGFSLRIIGGNKRAALSAGLSLKVSQLAAMAVAGAFAGVAGMTEIFGTQHQLIYGFGSGYGFDGIAVALLGGNGALGILGAGFLFSAMKTGGSQMQIFGQMPFALVNVLQGVIIIFVLLWMALERRREVGRSWTH